MVPKYVDARTSVMDCKDYEVLKILRYTKHKIYIGVQHLTEQEKQHIHIRLHLRVNQLNGPSKTMYTHFFVNLSSPTLLKKNLMPLNTKAVKIYLS